MTCLNLNQTLGSSMMPWGLRRPAGINPQHSERQASWTSVEPLVKGLILAGSIVLLAALVWTGRFWGRPSSLPHSFQGRVFWILAIGYGVVMYAALVWRVVLWRRYRPMPSVPDDRLPFVTVLIPAYNEGAMVRQAIHSAAASDYPDDRLELIIIDDGSTDDTWTHILAAAREARARISVTTIRQPENGGKRRALHAGFARARGDYTGETPLTAAVKGRPGPQVFVTVDSDSVLAPDALRNAVSPLVQDPSIGCVAGCVEVLNARQSLLTRFLKCTFSMSFKYFRAFQNEFRGVFCTPGALSVYRADVVRRLADEWLNQRFLGRPCVTGEDRAMTNLFLREGWMTAYQGNAVVRAEMPSTYGGVARMFLRWARSNIRETVFLFRFLFTPFRKEHLTAFRINIVLATLALIVPALLILNSTSLLLTNGDYFLRHAGLVILYALTMSAIYYRNERDSDWIWLLLYGFFWVPCLSWIIPYAALTLRNTGWLTRQTPGPCRAPAVAAEELLPSSPASVRLLPAA